jgi:hypothetical protein
MTTKVQTKNKIGRNEPCCCGSLRKYKVCCMNSLQTKFDFEKGQETHSTIIGSIISTLKEECPEITIIDITDTLTSENYRSYQIINYKKPVAMIAQRNETNNEVFLSRVNIESSDIILMYHGAYRTFPQRLFRSMLTNLSYFLKCNTIDG